MTMTFRTTGAWGPGKGANLTPAEVDENFYDVLLQLDEIRDNPTEPRQIVSIEVEDDQMLITMDDSSTFGPFTLPVATFQWRDEWLPATEYVTTDFFMEGVALYLVLQDHTSGATFSEDAGNMAGPYYRKLFDGSDLTMTYLDDGWLPLTAMDAFDVFSVADVGVFMVLRDHTSAATFDPDAVDDDDNPLYKKIFSPIETEKARIQYQLVGTLPADGSVVLCYIQDDLRDLVLEANFPESSAHLEVAVTAQMEWTIHYDGAEIGAITFSPSSLLDGDGGQYGTFSGTGATIANLELLRVRCASASDVTARHITISIVGSYAEPS